MGDHFVASEHMDDMTGLPELSENSILKNLQARYAGQIIYTYTGTILVACNPYKWISIYEDEYVKKYSQAKFGDLPPHIFAIAEASFSHMRINGENQSVIISGESGAGKTESTKLILQYLTAITTNQMWIEQQIMEASTILEAFGNAKTIRNNNSSRFGKFMQVQFDSQKRICGASIVNYLLEKSRVSNQAPDERNYHCFYQLVLGSTDEEKAKFKLLAPEKFQYLNQSGCIKVATIDDKKDFEALKLALTVMNLTPEDIDRLLKLLAAILHIGNVSFVDENDNAKVSNMDAVKTISELLECDQARLAEAFVFRSIIVRGEMTKTPLNVNAAKDNRDSVSKALYSRLFDWIVDYINISIKPTEATANFIGVLDIFGFELFKVNSFEQLCINYANEKLQQFFTNYIFKLEQGEYEKEGISWSKIDFIDNAECIDLFENKLGLFALLDEETRFPKGTDETFLAKINEKHEKHKYFIKPRQATANFGIKHYAGEVFYEIKGFLDKNKDEASELMFGALSSSAIPLVKTLVEVKLDEDDKGGKTMKKKLTVAGNFRQQLQSLVTVLGSTNPQYVRCIKPNSSKSSFLFEEELVLAQLRYSGMLETIRIRKAGYSVRVTFEQFLEKFKMLLSTIEGNTPKDRTLFLLKKLNIDNGHWQIGHSKIFMRNSVFIPLQEAKEKLLKEKAIAVSKVVISNYYRQIFMRKRKAMVIVQKYVRMFLARNRYNKQKKGAIVIQSVVRGWFARDFARMLRQQKREAEERARREAEEAEERRRQEEAAKKSREAAEAAAAEERKRKEHDEAERLRKLQEEQEILELTRQAQKVKVKMAKAETKVGGVDDLGDMFSFLDVVDDEFVSKDDKTHALDRMMQDLTSQIDEIYNVEADDYKKTINKKKKAPGEAGGAIPDAPPPPSGDIYQNIRKRNDYKTLRGSPVAMKSNPLQKKMEQEAAAAASAAQKNPEQPKEDTDDSLENFAAKHFEEHEKVSGTIGTLRKKKKYTIKEMLYYTRHAIPVSMLKFNVPEDPRKEKMITVAVEIFRELLKITDPLPKKEENIVPMIQNVVKLGIGVPELRDEILVQLVRQTTESPKDIKGWDSICIKGWQMLFICLSSFPPSKGFARYLRGYIRRHATMDPNAPEEEKEKEKDDEDTGPAEELTATEKQKRRIQLRTECVKFAKLCDEAFQQIILNGARKLPPSGIEIEAMKSARPIICRFYFLDGNVKAIGISSSTTAAQAIKDLAKRIDLPDTSGWSIYEVYPDSEYVVKGSDVIADILARWEIEKRNSATETKYQTMKKGATVVQNALGGGEAKFFLKKRLFRTPQKIPTDPVEYHLIYAQSVASVLRGDFPLNEQAALRLAALKCQVDWGDYDPEQKSRLNELHNYLTPRFAGIKSKEEYITEICSVHAKLAGKSLLQAKVLYLEAVKQFPLYGASLYPATFKGFWAHSNNLLIAVHVEGLAWVHPKTKAIMKSYKYDQIDSWELDVGTVAFTIKADSDGGESEALRLEFESKQNEEIVNLIKDYSPAHRVGKTKQEKVAEISAEEVSGLASDIEKARNKILEARILRLPGPAASSAPTGTTKFKTMSLVKNTIKGTLTKDKKRNSGTPEGASGSHEYTLTDWSFSKVRLSFSLLEMDLTLDADLHENALRMNQCIMAYAGMVPPPSGFPEDENPRAPMSFMIQDVIRGCLEVPRSRDELYLQLIKFTTSHPEPDSNTVLKLWKLLCIVCWIFPPSQVVLEYLRAHLRSCAYGTSPALSRRKKEREYAKYALKAIQRTQTNAGRKQPPSADEIASVIMMKPMFARFHFMDGQSRALTFDPATTTSEVLDMVKDKIGVKNCTGFSLFESFGSLERSMTGKEKVADTIFKWDKFAKQTNSDKVLKLVFKRRIFMPPLDQFSNDVERDLVMHQAIYDVVNDRYPVSEEEAAYLAGLRAQIELGDSGTYKAEEPVYADNVKKYLPKHFVKAGAPALVAAAHAKLKGKSKDDCKKLYMDFILSWELYGSTIFNVLQSYTSAMPNNLWLAVNHTGVHILNRRSKVPLLSYNYKSIVNYSPSHKNIMIMTESLTRGTKYVFNTSEASQIAHLIKDYTDVIIANRKKEAATATKNPKAATGKK